MSEEIKKTTISDIDFETNVIDNTIIVTSHIHFRETLKIPYSDDIKSEDDEKFERCLFKYKDSILSLSNRMKENIKRLEND